MKQCEHILLVSFYSGLIKRIHTEHIAGDTACALEEIDELTEVVFIDLLKAQVDIRNTAINVRKLGTKFGHLIDFIYAFSSKEIQTIEILFVHRHDNRFIGFLDRNNRLEDSAFALLNPLTHRVKIGCEIYRCGINAFMVFTL